MRVCSSSIQTKIQRSRNSLPWATSKSMAIWILLIYRQALTRGPSWASVPHPTSRTPLYMTLKEDNKINSNYSSNSKSHKVSVTHPISLPCKLSNSISTQPVWPHPNKSCLVVQVCRDRLITTLTTWHMDSRTKCKTSMGNRSSVWVTRSKEEALARDSMIAGKKSLSEAWITVNQAQSISKTSS